MTVIVDPDGLRQMAARCAEEHTYVSAVANAYPSVNATTGQVTAAVTEAVHVITAGVSARMAATLAATAEVARNAADAFEAADGDGARSLRDCLP